MWDCKEVQTLLKQIGNLLEALCIPLKFEKYTFIFSNSGGASSNTRLDNEITMLIKQYISNVDVTILGLC